MEPRMNSSKEQSSQYKVDDDVALPVKRSYRVSKYPFGDMLPNQSVEIAGKTYAAIIGSLRKHKLEGKKFTIRRSDAGHRVWRVK
jgi:hypothetical protein